MHNDMPLYNDFLIMTERDNLNALHKVSEYSHFKNEKIVKQEFLFSEAAFIWSNWLDWCVFVFSF